MSAEQPERGTWRRFLFPGRGDRPAFQATIALLVGLLGFALATQVRTNDEESGLSGARQEDLVRILDDLTTRSDRLREEIAALQRTRDRLTSGSDRRQAALEEARERARTLGVLAGTLRARGPGIELRISDPRGSVPADVLLDAVQELRDAGAEAMQIGPVRVVAATYLVDASVGISVDGTVVRPPYRLLAIGDPRTLAAALDIPGGLFDTVRRHEGATSTVRQLESVLVTALRPLRTPQYARPAPDDDG